MLVCRRYPYLAVLLGVLIILSANSNTALAQIISPWLMHHGNGIKFFGYKIPKLLINTEFKFSNIPPENDSGWVAAPDPDNINFFEESTLCDIVKCHRGAQFTYFQTFVDIPANTEVISFNINFGGVDDGIRVSIFNSSYPEGLIVPSGYFFYGDVIIENLESFINSGEINRIVVTHIDDCCFLSGLESASIQIELCSNIFVPNAFTPNGDNVNDIFYIYGIESGGHFFHFVIYNRWGKKVFESNDFNSGWDGIYNGRKLDSGIYAYHLKVTCESGGSYARKGEITLIG